SPRSPPRRGLQRRDEVEESFDEGALASTGGAGNDEHRLQGQTLRVAQDRHPLARIPVAPRSLKAAASRPRGSCLTSKPLGVAQDRNPLARIPVAPRSLKAAASRPRRSCLPSKPVGVAQD